MPRIESHSEAWNRVYYIKKAMSWPSEGKVPIRLRGYCELIMHRIQVKLRKKIDSALKRGYRLDRKTDLAKVLAMICDYNPIQPITLGYVGKTRMNVWLPTLDAAIHLQEELRAQTVMTEALEGNKVNHTHQPSKHGYYEVWVRQWVQAGGRGSSDQPQLKSQLSEMRTPIDEWLEQDEAVRYQIAHWCACDDSIIRIPFDTHQEE